MKNLILFLVFISCFSVSKSIAQRGMASTIGANTESSSRAVSNYSSSYNNTGGSANYTARTEATYSVPAQAVSYRKDAPAAGTNNVSLANVNSSISSAGAIAYSNNYSSGINTTSANNTQTVMRYNYKAKGVYAYYPSAQTKKRNGKVSDEIAPPYRLPHFHGSSYYISFNDFCFTPASQSSQPVYYTSFLYNNSALNMSLDGYVVYGNDTLSGIVTMTHDAVLLEQPIDSNGENGYAFSYKDKAMKSVVVFHGDDELYLTRASAKGGLLRVIHSGKLTLYDDVYSFPDGDNVDEGHLKIAYDGKLKSPGAFVVFDMRTPLMKAVNRTYGLHLKTEDMSLNNLLYYINTLD